MKLFSKSPGIFGTFIALLMQLTVIYLTALNLFDLFFLWGVSYVRKKTRLVIGIHCFQYITDLWNEGSIVNNNKNVTHS